MIRALLIGACVAALAAGSAAAQSTGGGAGGASPAGSTGDVQTNGGSGTFAGVTILTAPNGGSGVASPTAHGVLIGEGASAFASTALGTSGWCLTSNGAGADPTFQACAGGGATLGANTFTDKQTIANATANTNSIGITGGSITGSSTVSPGISVTGTVNTSGNIEGEVLFANITSTGCGVCNLIQIQKGGISQFALRDNGGLTLTGGISAVNYTLNSATQTITWTGRGVLSSKTTGSIQLGATDVASPVAQTLSAQSVIAGNANTAGVTLTIQGSLSNGSGAGGDINITTTGSVAGSGVQNTGVNAITIKGGTQLVAIPQITTGTNADFVCMNASLQFTIQTSACTISSRRFKAAIDYEPQDASLETILHLRPAAFNMDPKMGPNRDPNYYNRQLGLIAEDVAAVDPRLAIFENDGATPKSYRQEGVIAALVGAVQAQQKEIEELKAAVANDNAIIARFERSETLAGR